MNFFNQGIPLGRWFGITVVIHWTFLLYAANRVFGGGPGVDVRLTAIMMGLLFGTVLIHEFGHALSCKMMKGEAHQIILWPLGGIAFVQPPMNPTAWLVTTVCGPLVNAVLWPVFYYLTQYVAIREYGILGWMDIRDQVMAAQGIVTFTDVSMPVQICMYMWQINKMLLLFNLIPAYPMDGGRILQEVLWFAVGYRRSLTIAGMVGTVAGAGFVVVGLGLQGIYIQALHFSLGEKGVVHPILVIIGILCVMQSFAIYQQAKRIEEWRKA